MLKDMSSIKLQGANFYAATTLPILDSSDGKYAKASLIYGRNGSGKSTIARAFRKLKGDDVATVTTSVALDAANLPIALSEPERTSIFVFDEDFVNANVRIEEKGLGSIVMLGEQVDLTSQIELAEGELQKAEELVRTTCATLREYETGTNPKAPQFYINKIYGVLQRDDGWAGRDSRARGLRQNSRVTDDTYKRFINLTPEKTKDELILDYDSKMKELVAARSGMATISAVVPSVPDAYRQYSVIRANELIKQKIESPELSEREEYLFSLVTSGEASVLQTRIDQLILQFHFPL